MVVVLYHILISILWILKNDISTGSFINGSNEEFYRCVYPKSKNICLSYLIRNVKKNFKEDLVIPVYIYVLSTILVEIVNFQDITIIIQDIFGSFGAITNTIFILIFLYIIKLYNIYQPKNMNDKSLHSALVINFNNSFLEYNYSNKNSIGSSSNPSEKSLNFSEINGLF
ncbi:hypothetical protein H8356DRAFT_1069034 [Neocallimastix lanati (nom. inval.)]|nr:hypothetical protein H8356DRAFT_1069034 [Neocallimastix sp. JGI-2020a]